MIAARRPRLATRERQRIVLAGALLHRPALLMLDEAAGQFDAAAEREVAAALRSLRGRTTIVALTHRPAVMAAAYRIVLLENGRVAPPRPGPSWRPGPPKSHNRRDADPAGGSQAEAHRTRRDGDVVRISMDMGGNLAFTDAITNRPSDVQVRTLVVHRANGFSEHGMSLPLKCDLTPRARWD